MLLNRWRVGSLTMGIVLIAAGIISLVSVISKSNLFNLILMLWPIVLICLGLEVLFHLFMRKDEIKIKYDVFSIIMVSIILTFCMFFGAISFFSSFFETRDDFFDVVGIKNYSAYHEATEEFTEAEKLSIIGSWVSDITVLDTDEENIKTVVTISTRTSDKEYAEDILKRCINTEKGNKSYLSFNNSMTNDYKLDFTQIIITVYLPKDKKLDLSGTNGSFYYENSLKERIITNHT